jgi:hypothetical protein
VNDVIVDFSDNNLSEKDMLNALGSFSASSASLLLNFKRNNVTSLPAYLFANVSHINGEPASLLTLLLVENPISAINESVFSSTSTSAGYISSVKIDISNPTTGFVRVPSSFGYENIHWGSHVFAP